MDDHLDDSHDDERDDDEDDDDDKNTLKHEGHKRAKWQDTTLSPHCLRPPVFSFLPNSIVLSSPQTQASCSPQRSAEE